MADVPAFELSLRTRIVAGSGTLERLEELVRELGSARALLVTDPGLTAAGHPDRAAAALERAGVEVTRFAESRRDPTTADVDACLAVARTCDPDLLVAVGGGSSIDTAKGANFLLTNGGRMEDYWGVGKASRPMLPLIAVPTTAGTGSEVQSFALIGRESDHQKMACGDRRATPCIAILDPTLTATLPREVAARTGLDALAHAVETAVTSERTPASALFSRRAFEMVNASLPRALSEDPDEEARGAMLVGAAWAGLAIEHSMLGAAHSMANPLTVHHGLPHGQAVGMMLPHVVRYNAHEPDAAREYDRLAVLGGLEGKGAGALAARIEELSALGDMPGTLAECGVREADVPALAAEAAEQWTARFNPRPVDAAAFESLFRTALGHR